jgi:hypothetical protein
MAAKHVIVESTSFFIIYLGLLLFANVVFFGIVCSKLWLVGYTKVNHASNSRTTVYLIHHVVGKV